MDNDDFTIFYFLMAKLRRSCLACQCLNHGDGSPSVFTVLHTCYANAEKCVNENVELACLLFNVKLTERSLTNIRDMIMHSLKPNNPQPSWPDDSTT
jgi:hypothetical protein